MKAKTTDRAQALRDNMAKRKEQARTRDQTPVKQAGDDGLGGAAGVPDQQKGQS